jgi:hypothetical protein
MKKLKLATKKTNANNKKAKAEGKEDARTIQQLIFADVKNINKFNNLVEDFILALQNNDLKGTKDISEILIEIYDFFMTKNKSLISNDLKLFLQDKLNILFKVYLDIMSPADAEEESENFYKLILKDIQRFFKFSEEENIKSTIDSLVDQFLLNEELVESNLIKVLTASFIKSKKNLEMIFNSLFKKLNENKNVTLNSETLFNIYNFVIAMGKIPDEKLKFLYQNVIIFVVNSASVPKEILADLLTNLNKVIFDNLENPLIFSDYLINIYEKADDSEFEIKVLSLSGLFVLLTKYKLDYSNYYNMLYKTISMKHYNGTSLKTVFDSSNRNRIFKILELSLKSPTVSINVILSFIKKLARVSLFSPANNIAIILGIIQNIIKVHPRAVQLLFRNKKKSLKKPIKTIRTLDEKIKENEDDWSFYAKYEQFDDEELDASKTNANLSCLWELYSLKNHFSFKIRTIVAKFEKNFLKAKEFDLNSISNLKEQDLLYDINENAHFYISPSPASEDTLNKKFSLII